MVVFRRKRAGHFYVDLSVLVLLTAFLLQVPDAHSKKKEPPKEPEAREAAGAPAKTSDKKPE